MDRTGVLPPWYWPVHPSTALVTAALWAAMIVGTLAVPVGLSALRAGWQPDPVRLIAAGVLAVAVLAVTPPVGSTDMMDYATYGRIATLGHNPHVMTPYQLRRTGDPVARLSSKAWRNTPSVYGPVVTATEWAASRLGGSSAARTVWWLNTVVMGSGVRYILPFALLLLFVVLTVTARLRMWVRPATQWPPDHLPLPEVKQHAFS
jgi:hypothetical protein